MSLHSKTGSGGGVGKPSSAVVTFEECLTSLDRHFSLYLSVDRPVWSDPGDSAGFLELIDELVGTIRDFTPLARENKALGVALDRAEDLLQSVVFKLEEEFRVLIQRGGDSFDASDSDSDCDGDGDGDGDGDDYGGGGDIPVAHPVTDFNIIIDALPSLMINELHEKAKRMVMVEYGRECSHVYSACRREFLEESLSRLGLQKLSTDEVQKLPWPELEDEIERWCKSVVFALKVLFPSERRLCDRIFVGFNSISDFAFMEVCRASAIQLLNFADAIAISSRSPESLFKVLDIYETLRDLIPDFEILFSDQFCVFLRNKALAIWKQVGEAIRGIFMELENLICRDPAKNPVPGDGLHPIIRYVMNYLCAACKSQLTLEQVFDEEKERAMSGMNSLLVQMMWIMELLESNLETKSKVNYQRSTWNKVIGILKTENAGGSNVNGGPNSRPLKERFRMFNASFEEILNMQSSWIVFDDQLRDELKMAITQSLLPAYRDFVGRFQNSSEAGMNPEKHIKYSVEDVEARINNELFRGNSNGGWR